MKLVFGIGALALSLAACGGTSQRGADPSTKAEAAPAGTPSERAVEDRYDIEVELPAKSSKGRESLAKVHVHPQGDWHMNTQYPVRLSLQAPGGVKLVASELAKGDAERLDDEALTFAVPFTPASEGPKRFEGQLSFAMCGELACDPLTVPVDFTVDVAACDDTVKC
jgi:hypothetical protein